MDDRKYRRRKKLIVAYLLRAGIGFTLLISIILMVCGCLYICDLLNRSKKDFDSVVVSGDIPKNGYSFTMGELSGDDGTEDSYNDKTVDVDEESSAKSTPLVVLDAGHGGTDQGTSKGSILEKNINLAVIYQIKEKLEDEGIKVMLTRDSDRSIELEERAEIANKAEADLFISIHCNYYENDDGISGLECYYNPSSSQGKVYADSIISACEESERIIVRNVKPEDFSVLRNTRMPAVLVEIGYMSNHTELINLTDENYQSHLAEKITEGILKELS